MIVIPPEAQFSGATRFSTKEKPLPFKPSMSVLLMAMKSQQFAFREVCSAPKMQ
jgi:hypothetical protein